MIKSNSLIIFFLFLFSAGVFSQEKVLLPFEYGKVTLHECDLKAKMDAEKDFYMNLSNDDLLKGFRLRRGMSAPGKGLTGWYQADIFHIFGQLLSGYSRYYAATGDKVIEEKATYLYKEWAKTIDQDGYFFYSNSPNDYHYIFDKTLCGVIDYYQYCNAHSKVLETMEKITDWAIANLDRSRPLSGFYPGEWYTLSENLYRAYQITKNSKYSDFAKVWEYSEFWEPIRINGNPFKNEPALHAYSHLNSLCSAAAAYEFSGKEEYLQTSINGYDFFRSNQCFVTGGFGVDEKIVNPSKIQELLTNSNNSFEVHCSCWACFKLGKYLMSFTGDARFGDWVEQLMINGIGANIPMTQDGKNYHYANYNPCGAYKTNHTDGWWCCAGTRIQAFADVPNLIWFHDMNNLYLNLFLSSELQWKGMTLSQETNFPKENKTIIRFKGESAEFIFSFRRPEWVSANPIVKVNGNSVDVQEAKNWLSINKEWKNGDFIEIEFPMDFVVIPLPKGKAYPAALKYGPVAMVVKNAEQYPVDALSKPKCALSSDLTFGITDYPDWKIVPYYTIVENERYCLYLDPQSSYKIEKIDIDNYGNNWNEYAGLYVTNNIGNYIEAQFKGTGVRWRGYSYDDSGMVDVYIDNKFIETVDQYNSKRDVPFFWEKKDLEFGEHTLKLVLSPEKNVKSNGNFMNYLQFLYYNENTTDVESIEEASPVSLIGSMLYFDTSLLGKQIIISRYNLQGTLMKQQELTVSSISHPLEDSVNFCPYLILVRTKNGVDLLRGKIFK